MTATTAPHLFRPRLWTLLGAAAGAAGVVGFLVWLLGSDPAAARPPRPVSHVDTATRACLLTSTDSDPGLPATWAAMRGLAGGGTSGVVVQRYRLPDGADGATYVNTLVQLRCSTIVSTGTGARAAVATTLATGHPRGVRFAVVADRPVAGATRVGPGSVSTRALAGLIGGHKRP
ncbi:hypothetical protein [Streptomyces griseorubiginosus]|uniref:hypothetical protein n=1 Tax=Streptomyces griseorubiginosus TaxID=67304 RepID=UPI002E820D5E|nr:hypothetical protein [Streptomyces griseorubiginosus]WUB43392.1 hypothetical protein OHN19_08630 [Streptomyces griseorubiginosus]WUB51911.1 hypothetical protein OG942_08625 [Streptomyces griseorubiginosus]